MRLLIKEMPFVWKQQKLFVPASGSYTVTSFTGKYRGIRANTITIAIVTTMHETMETPSMGFIFHNAWPIFLLNQYYSFL
jgi:hypothetical protein